MPASQFKQGEPKRKENIPSDIRTPGKDEAADAIDEIIESGRWPMDIKDIADEAGWSRQHIANTLEGYYQTEHVESDNGNENAVNSTKIRTSDKLAHDVVELDIPKDVTDPEDYVRGWFAGWMQRDEQNGT